MRRDSLMGETDDWMECRKWMSETVMGIESEGEGSCPRGSPERGMESGEMMGWSTGIARGVGRGTVWREISGLNEGLLSVGPPATVIERAIDSRLSSGTGGMCCELSVRRDRAELLVDRFDEEDCRSERERDVEPEELDEKSMKDRNVDGRDGPASAFDPSTLPRVSACLSDWGSERPPVLRYLSVRRSGRGCDGAANSTLREGVTFSPVSGSDVGVNIWLSRIPLLLSRPCISRGPLGRAVREDDGERTRDSVSGGVVVTGCGIADPCEPREGGSGV